MRFLMGIGIALAKSVIAGLSNPGALDASDDENSGLLYWVGY